MSTEKRVRVRVKLYDDKTDIYSQDIDMSTGEGGFIVPTVMADAPYVNLQVRLSLLLKRGSTTVPPLNSYFGIVEVRVLSQEQFLIKYSAI